MIPTQRSPRGQQQLTVSSAAVNLTRPAGTRSAVIRCGTTAVRWRDDGTAPTSTVGMPLNAGEQLDYDGNCAAIQFIRTSGTDSILDISYYA